MTQAVPLGGVLRLRTFAALRHREFRLLWSGQAATAMAQWMDQVVRGWLIYELTNSPVQPGLVYGVQAIPILVLSPVAGGVADRYPRKQQVVIAQVLAGVTFAGLALLTRRAVRRTRVDVVGSPGLRHLPDRGIDHAIRLALRDPATVPGASLDWNTLEQVLSSLEMSAKYVIPTFRAAARANHVPAGV